nr:2-oxo acid dehydrogenase subunit E2 [Nocardioides sp. B-3]
MDFAQFWTAYEEIVRKAKDNKLTMEDYSGTTVSLTNVGGPGTNNSVPRLMQGRAAIIGVGSMDYPPESRGCLRGDPDPQRRLAHHDDDVHLRPPRHPGRTVRRVPPCRAPAAARRRRLLRRDLPRPADPLRAHPLGPGRLRQSRRRRQQAGPDPRADPRLPRARPPDGRHRPAGVQAAQPPRPRGRGARPDPVGPRPRVRDR